MFNQLRLAGYIGKISGVLLANFTDCIESDPQRKSLTLNDVFEDYLLKDMNIPVLYNLNHGHADNNLTLPMGVMVKINGNNCSLDFLEDHIV